MMKVNKFQKMAVAIFTVGMICNIVGTFIAPTVFGRITYALTASCWAVCIISELLKGVRSVSGEINITVDAREFADESYNSDEDDMDDDED